MTTPDRIIVHGIDNAIEVLSRLHTAEQKIIEHETLSQITIQPRNA